MKVSILIPVYNSEKYIAQTIESALSQSWLNKEIIVVDDGSTDNSLVIAQSYESEILKVYSQKNTGASAARNHAFFKSSGDYIQYLDADDLLDKNKIENQLEIAEKFNFDDKLLITGKLYSFVNEVADAELYIQSVYKDYQNPIELLIDYFDNFEFMTPHNYLSPRKLIEESAGWDESLNANDDGEFFARVIEKAKVVVFTSKSIAYYRNLPNSLSKQKGSKYVLSEYKSLINTCELILSKQLNERSRMACEKVLNWYIVEWFPQNIPTLINLEKYMKKNNINYQQLSSNKKFIFMVNTWGWRKALLFSFNYSKIKGLFGN